MPRRTRRPAGFTLIELLIVVALVALVLTLAAPSFRDFILMQRLKSINAQVVTDLAYARSEAVGRGVPVQVRFQASGGGQPTMSCYVFYTYADANPANGRGKCDCSQPEGSRCLIDAPNTVEIRTVQVPVNLSVFVEAMPNQATDFSYDPRTGGMTAGAVDVVVPDPNNFGIDAYIDNARKLRDVVGQSGRTKVCAPAGSNMPGWTAC